MKLFTTVLALSLMCGTAYAADNNTATTGTTTQMKSTGVTGKAAGEAFLAANKSKPGVVTLPDGLQYKVITQGTGAQPTDTDIVTVHYAGTLVDGTEFDSSYKRGEPASFPVSGVIPGWTEALKLMKAGSTWELYVPATLAYGDRGAPPAIGPNETLIFKVNLISVKKQ
jgi:FKBP-type peptidyl-prolyl cis-trans isomerase FklB